MRNIWCVFFGFAVTLAIAAAPSTQPTISALQSQVALLQKENAALRSAIILNTSPKNLYFNIKAGTCADMNKLI